jgi:zinc protease
MATYASLRPLSKSLLVSFFALLLISATFAQTNLAEAIPPLIEQNAAEPYLSGPLPQDKSYKTGILSNGMRYFIRKNAKPEKQVELRLIIRAGSLQETEDQQGLAHFVEHMCFNGTKNFQKNDLIHYLESTGSRFGAHVNAYTSFDRTVYMLTINTDSANRLQKGMLILEDWANAVTFAPEEIEKERGVVIEEWRLRLGAYTRMMYQYYPNLFYQSRYAQRLPIGQKEVLDKFSHQTLKDYYTNWYRPDLMAVVAVGDLEPDAIERLIKERFGAIAKHPNPQPRTEFPVPPHQDTKYNIVTDAEARSFNFTLYCKRPTIRYNTYDDLKERVQINLIEQMLNNRFNELTQKGKPPYSAAFTYNYNIASTKNASILSVYCLEDKIMYGIETAMIELEKANRKGFLETELKRAIADLLTMYDKQYKEESKRESDDVADEVIDHVVDGEALTTIKDLYKFYQDFVPTIKLADLNAKMPSLYPQSDRVLVLTGPEKAGIKVPTEAELKSLVSRIQQQNLDAFVDKYKDAPLVPKLPAPGAIREQKTYAKVGVTALTLNNGVQVWIKPTDFKNDEVLINAYSFGGTSTASDADHMDARLADDIFYQSGVGDFDLIELEKKMAGKVVNVMPVIGTHTEGIRGQANKSSLKDLFEMTYLYFTAPRADQESFQSYIERTASSLKNKGVSPEATFYDSFTVVLNQNHPRTIPLTEPLVRTVQLEKALNFYRSRFTNAGDFVFFIVGNVNVDSLKPYLNQYLGSLPAKKPYDSFVNEGIKPPKGVVKKTVFKGKEPKSMVRIAYHGKINYSAKDRNAMLLYGEILERRLREVLREELGGTYSVGARPNIERFPKPYFYFNVQFGCSPDNLDKLVNEVHFQIRRMEINPPTETELKNVKAIRLKELETQQKTNYFWLSYLTNSHQNAGQVLPVEQSVRLIESLTADDVLRIGKKYMNPKRYVQVALVPVSY